MTPKLCLLWLLLAFSIYPFLSYSQEIFYNGFQLTKDDLTLNGVAQIEINDLLKLTNSTPGLVGHAFHPYSIRIKESPSSPVLSFSTVFAFSIIPQLQTIGGHGMAFTMPPDKQLNGAFAYHYLGLLNSTDDGNLTNHVFAIEFDTVMNFEFGDINDNHVGIIINSLHSNASVAAGYFVDGNSTAQDLILRSGKIIFAWIDYDSKKTKVDVGLALSYQTPNRSILSFKVDLSPYLDEFMYVGFSASTGELRSLHYFLGWSFNVNGQARTLQPSPLPFSPMPSPNTKDSPSEMKRKRIPLMQIVAVSSCVLILLLASSLGFCIYKMKTKQFCQEDVSDITIVESLHMESYIIRATTHNFSIDKKLEQGGFGQVYKDT